MQYLVAVFWHRTRPLWAGTSLPSSLGFLQPGAGAARVSWSRRFFLYIGTSWGIQVPNIVLGKGSGIPSVAIWLEDRGMAATPGQIEALTLLVKEKSLAKKGLLTEQEFRDLAASVLGQS